MILNAILIGQFCLVLEFIEKLDQTIPTLFFLAPLAEHNVFEVYSYCVSTVHSFLLLRIIPSHEPTSVFLSIFLLMGLWVVSSWEPFTIMLLGVFTCKSFCGHMFSFLLSNYTGAKLLNHKVGVCLTLHEIASFPK